MLAVAERQRIGHRDEAADRRFRQTSKHRVEVGDGAGLQRLQDQLLSRGRGSELSHLSLQAARARVPERTDPNERRDRLFKELEALARQTFLGAERHSGDVPTGSPQALDEPDADRIAHPPEHDGHGTRDTLRGAAPGVEATTST